MDKIKNATGSTEQLSVQRAILEKDAEIENEIKTSIMVTLLFEELGYDLNERTTYYYRDFVVAASQYLQKNSGQDAEYELALEIKDRYSNLYHEVAKDKHNILFGVFYAVINKVYYEANHKSANQELAQEIYHGVPRSMEENTLLIASFVSRKMKEKEVINNKKYFKNEARMNLKLASY